MDIIKQRLEKCFELVNKLADRKITTTVELKGTITAIAMAARKGEAEIELLRKIISMMSRAINDLNNETSELKTKLLNELRKTKKE